MAVETVAEQKEKKTRKRKADAGGEQLQLLETAHPMAKKIIDTARKYKRLVRERSEILRDEVKEKEKMKALVRETDLKPDADGVIEFRCGKVVVTVTPRDELIRVKDDDGNGDGG